MLAKKMTVNAKFIMFNISKYVISRQTPSPDEIENDKWWMYHTSC